MEEAKIKEFVDKLMTQHIKLSESFKFGIDSQIIDLDLGMPHLLVLHLLTEKPEAPIITDLVHELSISNSMMTHIIDHIESAGLVQRTRDHSDRRIVKVEITAKGRDIAEKCDKGHRDSITFFVKSLSAEDQEQFINAVNVLIGMMEKRNLLEKHPQ